MRRILISVDMEGVSAVTSRPALMPEGWEWPAARRWMTEEFNAVAQAAFGAGYDEIVAVDSHGTGLNLDPDLIPDNVRLVRAGPRAFSQMEGIDERDIDACAFVGYHNAATASGLFAHTFSGAAFRAVYLNGELASEGYFNAALAGEFGKPVVFVSGDQYTIEDARRYAPNVIGYVTKQTLGWSSQSALPPKQVCRELKEAAERAFGAKRSAPFKLSGPFEVKLVMTTQTAAEVLAYLTSVERVDNHTVRVSFGSMADAMRFVSFAARYTPTGV